MHEASAAEAIVRLVGEELGRRTGAGTVAVSLPLPRVAKLNLVVGESTGYMEESLAFYLALYGKGGPLEGAALSIRYVKPRFLCRACGTEFERRRFSFDCPACGKPGELVSSGSDLFIDSIELEE